ncbi:MAG: putative ABC transport system permease protein [Cyclobacteriaceae bacterium]|jgi:putative ABC transport system permease protein
MFRNYLQIAFRSLLKNKSYVLINTFGLGIALACCITAYLLLAFNIEFDDFYEDDKVADIFRIHTNFTQPEGTLGQHINSPINMGPAILQDIAGIKQFTRYNGTSGFVRYGDKSFNEGVVFADSVFFEMFDYPISKGSYESFKDKNAVILSTKVAEKYFPDENPIGKVLTYNFANDKEILGVVAAVIEEVPQNSSMTFDMMMRIENFMDIYNLSTEEWGDWRDPTVFVQLTNPKNYSQMTSLFQQYVPLRNEMKADAKVASFELYPFKSSVNQDDIAWSMINVRMSLIPLIVFSLMALMILLIACFNLTNTSIAIATKRLKEVGVRKTMGASRVQIVIQFLLEMLMTIVLSLIVGYAFSNIIVKEFVEMWNLPYNLSDLNGLNFVIMLLILIFVTALTAGLYPALFSSKFNPVELLKGNVKFKGTNFFTKTLVGAQFAISVIVLLNGIVFMQNTSFQEKVDFGYDMEKVLTVNVQNEQEYEVLKNRAAFNPKVALTSITHHCLGWSSYPFPVKIDTTEYQVQHIEIGENFFEVMGMRLTEGRFLNMNNATDEFKAIVVNKAFIDHVGMTDPIGKIVHVRDEKRRIVGVVENHVDNFFRSKDPEPFAFYASKHNEYQMMLVRATDDDLADLTTFFETTWKEEFPEKPFQSNYQEEMVLDGMRQTNNNLKKIFLFLTILGGLLSAAGIYALASLNIEKRNKEIGIRKALGATVKQVVFLLGKEFAIILTIAATIGALIGFFLSTMLLNEIYAYHVEVGILATIFAAIVICLIGLLSTSSIILKAALANPVVSLRDE